MKKFEVYLEDNTFQAMNTNSFIDLSPKDIITCSTKYDKTPNDIHLYEVIDTYSGKFIKKSCCGNFNLKTQIPITGFEVKNEKEMRVHAASVGKKMCGVCVSRLYSNTDTSEK